MRHRFIKRVVAIAALLLITAFFCVGTISAGTKPNCCVQKPTQKTVIPSYNSKANEAKLCYYATTYADYYGVERELVYAIIWHETKWNPLATSNVGAQGAMQLMPSTQRAYGVVQPYDISDNIGGGVAYLADLMKQFHGDMRLALAAYYAGTKWVGKKGLSYNNPEVTKYVRDMRKLYNEQLKHPGCHVRGTLK